jgi:hypothetical protein
MADNSDTRPEMTEEDKAMSKIIERRVEGFQDEKKAQSLESRINIAYLCGYQNIQVVNGFIQPLPSNMVVNIIDNKILPAVVNDIAVSTKSSPTFDIVPANTTQEDEATAVVAQKMIQYLQRVNGKTLCRGEAVMWYDIAGVGWRKIYWDPYYRVVGRNPGPEDPGHNPEKNFGDPVFEGEVVIEHVANTELIYDYRTKNVHKQQWMIHTKTITMSEVRTRYGDEFASTINPDEVRDTFTHEQGGFESGILSQFSELAKGITAPTRKHDAGLEDDKLVTYYEFWHVPNATMPLGAYAVKVGDRMAVNQPYPLETYTHGELPFVPAAPVQLSGVAPRAVSRITQARPLQREYNELRSMIADGLNAMGNSVLMVPMGSKVQYKKLTNTNGNIIEYDGPLKPTREPGVQIPGAVFAYIGEVRRGIDEIFSFPDASRGQTTPSSPDSARGLQLLQDAAHTQLGPMISGFDRSDEHVVRQAIALGLTHYADRLLPIVGEDNSWTLYRVNKEELEGRISVIVRSGSSLPLNKALEAERAFMVWQSGLLGDPNSAEVRNYVIRQMDLGGVDNILKTNHKQKDFAQKEFITAEQMAADMPPIPPQMTPEEAEELISRFLFMPPPNMFDDHQMHVQAHTDFILDNYWKYKGSGKPQLMLLGQAMLDHTNMHAQVMAKQQQLASQGGIQGEAFTKGNSIEQIMAKQASDFAKVEADIMKIKADKARPTSKPASK